MSGIITEWVNDGMKTDYMAHLEELKALQKTWGTVIAKSPTGARKP